MNTIQTSKLHNINLVFVLLSTTVPKNMESIIKEMFKTELFICCVFHGIKKDKKDLFIKFVFWIYKKGN